MLDSQKVRQMCMAAGVPTPIDDASLIETLAKNALFLNQFLVETEWTPEALPKTVIAGKAKAPSENLKKLRKPSMK